MSTRLQDLLNLSHVPRWTTHPVRRPQSVAEHSYRVAVLAMEIRERLPLETSMGIRIGPMLRWAMVHDGPESKLGDTPAPAKLLMGKALMNSLERGACDWYTQETLACERNEHAIVHIADYLESLSWVARYGDGLNDHFDGEDLTTKLRRQVHERAHAVQDQFSMKGVVDAVQSILGEIVK